MYFYIYGAENEPD